MSLEISITYCAVWNYEPKAVGLADTLLGLKQQIRSLTLIPAAGGVFEVSVNGRTIYSKAETGKFPEPDAVLKQIQGILRAWVVSGRG